MPIYTIKKSLKKYALSMGDKMAAGALGAQGIMGEAAPPRPNLLDVPSKSVRNSLQTYVR